MELRLCPSTVVLMARRTWALCILQVGMSSMTVGSGILDRMNPPRPHASKWISKSLLQATKFPDDSFVRCFSTEAFGADVLAGGLYDVRGIELDMVGIVRELVMNVVISEEPAEW